ncbi:DUF4118 domain-containing protein [Streptomyces misionensis]|uniref:DUF4118 domain-containing protein n=1 Tax=Streptomyces misionensis TaxID=67331 RepID=UPI0036982700
MADYFFVQPMHSLTMARVGDAAVLVVFLAVAAAISVAVERSARRALAGFFRPGNITVLRELADQWIREHAQDHATGLGAPTTRRGSRIIAALTGEAEGERILHRAAQLAAGTGAELVGVHVRNPSGLKEPDPPWLNSQRRLLAELGGRYAQVAGEDVARALLDFTRAEHASQLVLGASRRSHGYQMLYGSVIDRVVRAAGPVKVHVIPPHRPPRHRLTARLPRLARPMRRRRASLPVRRTAIGWTLSVLAPAAVTALLPVRGSLGLAGALLCTLLSVVLAALVGGVGPAALATVAGFLAVDFLYTRPYYSLRVDRPIDLVGLFVFAVVGITVGLLVDGLARRALQVTRAQAEAENTPASDGRRMGGRSGGRSLPTGGPGRRGVHRRSGRRPNSRAGRRPSERRGRPAPAGVHRPAPPRGGDTTTAAHRWWRP